VTTRKLLNPLATFIALLAGCSPRGAPSTAALATTVTATPSAALASAALGETRLPEHVYWGDQHVHTGWSADARLECAAR
jgi:hypothetical protein